MIKWMQRGMPNWRVFESNGLECMKIFLSVNTMHFHGHFGKTPVGCIVGLHSDMVLPFTVVLVQLFDVMWCGFLKLFFLGKVFIDLSSLVAVRTALELGYCRYQKLKWERIKKVSDLKKMWKKLKPSALMPFKSLMTHSFDWLNLAASVVFWVYLWKPTIVGFVILCIQ